MEGTLYKIGDRVLFSSRHLQNIGSFGAQGTWRGVITNIYAMSKHGPEVYATIKWDHDETTNAHVAALVREKQLHLERN